MNLKIEPSDNGPPAPLISVIMNCYNGEKYLSDAINSVLSQTMANWELIFWDNQSTDESQNIVKSYNDSRIKYYFAPTHTTLGKARNLAVSRATGTWITFLDTDDLMLPNNLSTQAIFMNSDVGIIYGRTKLLYECGSESDGFLRRLTLGDVYPKILPLPSGSIFKQLTRSCFIPLPAAIISRKSYVKVGGIDDSLRMSEDYDLFLKISRIEKVISHDRIETVYRIHRDNLSQSHLHQTFRESTALIRRHSTGLTRILGLFMWRMRYIKTLAIKNRIREWKFL